jgi:hypothetical protein
MIKAYFNGVCSILKHGKDSIKYHVKSLKDLALIIDHFDNFPLITQKRADFLLFAKVVNLMKHGEHLTTDGLHKIVAIKASINKGLSEELQNAFPNIVSVARPIIELPENIDPDWLAGFVSGSPSQGLPIRTPNLVSKRSYSTVKGRKANVATECTDLVIWGTNLSSTVGVKFTRTQLSMINLPSHILGVMVGLILSDAWVVFDSTRSKNALLGFAQSAAHAGYF